MIDINQLDRYVITPTLDVLDMNSLRARQLLVGTYIQEAIIAKITYLHQVGGPAISLYGIEDKTYYDIYDNYLQRRKSIARKINKLTQYLGNPDDMHGNLYHATAMARVHYWRRPEPIPDTPLEMAKYYKKFYNTIEGKADANEAVKHFETAFYLLK